MNDAIDQIILSLQGAKAASMLRDLFEDESGAEHQAAKFCQAELIANAKDLLEELG